jgi:hypothetical protein
MASERILVSLSMTRHRFNHQILLLQGGGALGAYHAGVYEGMAEAGLAPTWVVGISIGAITAALIAGNPPERRVERLRAFWDRVSSYAPLTWPAWLEPMRPALNSLSASIVATFGSPGFFVPRLPLPFLAAGGGPAAVSFYDTTPLRRTLEELVDFNLINRREVRISLGAVNLRTGASLGEVLERHKDIQYASRQRFSVEHAVKIGELRGALIRLMDKLPAHLRADSDAQVLATLCDDRQWLVVRLMNDRLAHVSQTKDYEFSRATVIEHWGAGLDDTRRVVANRDAVTPASLIPGVWVYEGADASPAPARPHAHGEPQSSISKIAQRNRSWNAKA